MEQIKISFDDGQTVMNFAEAALLIQGSACIYSKKVRYKIGEQPTAYPGSSPLAKSQHYIILLFCRDCCGRLFNNELPKPR